MQISALVEPFSTTVEFIEKKKKITRTSTEHLDARDWISVVRLVSQYERRIVEERRTGSAARKKSHLDRRKVERQRAARNEKRWAERRCEGVNPQTEWKRRTDGGWWRTRVVGRSRGGRGCAMGARRGPGNREIRLREKNGRKKQRNGGTKRAIWNVCASTDRRPLIEFN